MNERPVLSVGIIFKNEIRCLERCLKALTPLREAVPCEVVMADTGSEDGSRAVAERYADILFDFPWINDFSAARNAVMDRCSGAWYMSIDADEWLGGDVSQLAGFLRDPERWEQPHCAVIVRNYFTEDLDAEYSDFLAVRLVRLSTGTRFVGAIHEMWDHRGNVTGLLDVLFHHDGYVGFAGSEKGKQERNMALLREKLERDPEDLKTLLQCIESAGGTSSYEWYVRQALSAVEKKRPLWKHYGPPILRFALFHAVAHRLPEREKWADWAQSWFPESPYVKIDIAYMLFVGCAQEKEYDKAAPFGERYLQAMEDYWQRKFDFSAILFSSLSMATRYRENTARAVLADVYFQLGRLREAKETLLSVDRRFLLPEMGELYMASLLNLQAQGGEDLSPVMAAFWEELEGEENPKKREKRRSAVIRASALVFGREYREGEAEQGFRHAYTLFLPLASRCGLGIAAAILETEEPARLEALLSSVTDWEELPIAALSHALAQGAAFPLPGMSLCAEELDTLALRLAGDPEAFLPLVPRLTEQAGEGRLLDWQRGLVLAALRAYPWPDRERDAEEGMALARAFARIEERYLPACYAPGVLEAEGLRMLPPLHRFGHSCVQAFAALDAGDRSGYVRLLREGLALCQSAAPMAGFLLACTPQLHQELDPAGAELLALAEQVRTVLSLYDPEDPAVEAVRRSPAYQRVAPLLEGRRN